VANTLYVVVYSSALSAPTSTQIAAGQDVNGSAAVFADSQTTTVTNPYTFPVTGLTAGVSYKASFWHDDADPSDIETTDAFTTFNAITGTGALTSANSSLSAFGSLAGTVTATFDWNTDAESFTHTSPNAVTTASRIANSGDGNTGCLDNSTTGNRATDEPYWSRTLTFEDLGVPAGATVNAITSGSIKSKCYVRQNADGSTIGPVQLINGAATVTLANTRSVSGTDSNFVTQSGIDFSDLNYASDTSVTIKLGANINLGNDVNAEFSWYFDTLSFDISYGTGITAIIGSGDLDSQASSLSGSGDVSGAITGTGALSSQASSLAGTGAVQGNVTGTAALSSQSSSIAGTGVREVTSTGALASGNSTLAGTGTVTEAGVITGSGAIVAQDSSIAGSGILARDGTGTIEAGVATIDATGIIGRTGTGALSSQASAISATGIVYTPGTITGTGTLTASSSTISGTGRKSGWSNVPPVSSVWTDISAASNAWTEI
jgi:hypothetical protein